MTGKSQTREEVKNSGGKPMGVVFTAILVALFGIFNLLAGLAIAGLGGLLSSFGIDGASMAVVSGVIAFVLGIAMFVSTYGLFARESWAWDLTIIVFVIESARNLFGLVTSGFGIIGLVVLALQVLIIAYVFTKQDYFGGPYINAMRS